MPWKRMTTWKKYATEERKNPFIIDHIEVASVLVFNKDGIGYRGGARGKKEKA